MACCDGVHLIQISIKQLVPFVCRREEEEILGKVTSRSVNEFSGFLERMDAFRLCGEMAMQLRLF